MYHSKTTLILNCMVDGWKKHSIFFLIGLLSSFTFLGSFLYAQTEAPKVTLSHKEIGIEDTLSLTIELGKSSPNIENLSITSTTLRNLGQIGSAHRLFFSNNQTFQQKTYTYALKPLKVGEASFILNFPTQSYGPYKLKVVPGSILSNKKIPAPPLIPHSPNSLQTPTEDDFIIESTLDKETLYVNQPTYYRVYLYNRVNFKPLSINPPSHNGISIVENFHTEQQRQTVIKNGKTYTKRLVRENIIYPIKVGIHTIENSFIEVLLVHPGFFTKNFRKTLVIPPVTLTARNYPKPKTATRATSFFRNDYGDFKLSLTQSQEKYSINSPITLSLRISGTGNLKALLLPDLSTLLVNNVNMQEYFSIRKGPVTEQYVQKKTGFFSGYKEIEYFLVGETPGIFTFSPLLFTYFSHKTNDYQTLQNTLKPITLLTSLASHTSIENELTNSLSNLKEKQPQSSEEDHLKRFVLNSLFNSNSSSSPVKALETLTLPQNTLEKTLSLKQSPYPLPTIVFYHIVALLFIGSFIFVNHKKRKNPNKTSLITTPTETPRLPFGLHSLIPSELKSDTTASKPLPYSTQIYQNTRQTIIRFNKSITAPSHQISSKTHDKTLNTFLETLHNYLKSNCLPCLLTFHLNASNTSPIQENTDPLLKQLLTKIDSLPHQNLSIREYQHILTTLTTIHSHKKWLTKLSPAFTKLLSLMKQTEQHLYAPKKKEKTSSDSEITTARLKTILKTTLTELKTLDNSFRKYSELSQKS